MAALAIAFLLQQAHLSQEAHHHIRENGFPGELRIIHPQRPAFRTANRPFQHSLRGVSFVQALRSLFRLRRRHLQTHAGCGSGDEPESGHSQLVMKFSLNTGLRQPLPNNIGFGAGAKEGYSNSFHKVSAFFELCCIAQSSLTEMHDHHVCSPPKGEQAPDLVHPSSWHFSRGAILQAQCAMRIWPRLQLVDRAGFMACVFWPRLFDISESDVWSNEICCNYES